MVLWTGKRIANATLYKEKQKPSFFKIGAEHFVFIVLYIICLYFCYITIGEQYVEALTMYENQEINVIDDFEMLRKKADDFLAGKLPDQSTVTSSTSHSPNYVIPSKWSPGFWPSIALGVVAILHALFVLGQIWSVKFRCMVNFNAETKANSATHIHVVPAAHQGKELLVPIKRTADGALFFDFHRRKYLFDAKKNCFEKVKCRVDYSVNHFTKWRGVPSELMYSQLKELYGPNRFQMASPSFMDLYWEQVSP